MEKDQESSCNDPEQMDFQEAKERFQEIWKGFVPANIHPCEAESVEVFRTMAERSLQTIVEATKDFDSVLLTNGIKLPAHFVAFQFIQALALFCTLGMSLNHIKETDVQARLFHIIQHLGIVGHAQHSNLEDIFEAFTIKLIQELPGVNAKVIVDLFGDSTNSFSPRELVVNRKKKSLLN